MATSVGPPMNEITVFVFARTDIGMHRSGNEDAFLIADLTTGNVGLGPDMSTHRIGERGSLMVVSDGMGGAVAGEIASELAVTSIRESLMEMPLDLGISERLKMAAEIANERIWNHAQENPELTGMGATLTAVLVQSNVAYIAQVGDSRAYLIRGEQIKQLTKDQSLAQMLVDSGAIQPDQIASVPQNVIMQALGTQPNVKVVLTAVELFRNDSLLVCSDGLSNKVHGGEELRQITEESENLTVACRRLVEIANERGGEDNITVIIARFDGEALHTATDSSSITGSFLAINEDFMVEKSAGSASQYTPPPPPPPQPDGESKPPTTLVMQAIPPSPSSETRAPDVEDATQPLSAETQGGLPETAVLASSEPQPPQQPPLDERITEPVTVPQVMEPQQPSPEMKPTTKKKSFLVILMIAFLSLALLAAAAYFFYFYYYKPNMEQRNAPAQPTISQPNG